MNFTPIEPNPLSAQAVHRVTRPIPTKEIPNRDLFSPQPVCIRRQMTPSPERRKPRKPFTHSDIGPLSRAFEILEIVSE